MAIGPSSPSSRPGGSPRPRSLAEVLPERPVAVCRELTKRFEEVARGSAAELAARFAEAPKGEITLVVGPRGSGADEDGLRAALAAVAELVGGGDAAEAAAEVVSRLTGVSRNDLYRALSVTQPRGQTVTFCNNHVTNIDNDGRRRLPLSNTCSHHGQQRWSPCADSARRCLVARRSSSPGPAPRLDLARERARPPALLVRSRASVRGRAASRHRRRRRARRAVARARRGTGRPSPAPCPGSGKSRLDSHLRRLVRDAHPARLDRGREGCAVAEGDVVGTLGRRRRRRPLRPARNPPRRPGSGLRRPAVAAAAATGGRRSERRGRAARGARDRAGARRLGRAGRSPRLRPTRRRRHRYPLRRFRSRAFRSDSCARSRDSVGCGGGRAAGSCGSARADRGRAADDSVASPVRPAASACGGADPPSADPTRPRPEPTRPAVAPFRVRSRAPARPAAVPVVKPRASRVAASSPAEATTERTVAAPSARPAATPQQPGVHSTADGRGRGSLRSPRRRRPPSRRRPSPRRPSRRAAAARPAVSAPAPAGERGQPRTERPPLRSPTLGQARATRPCPRRRTRRRVRGTTRFPFAAPTVAPPAIAAPDGHGAAGTAGSPCFRVCSRCCSLVARRRAGVRHPFV